MEFGIVRKQFFLVALAIFVGINVGFLAIQRFSARHRYIVSSVSSKNLTVLENTIRLLSENYNQLSDRILESWLFLRNKIQQQNNSTLQSNFYDRYRYLLALSERLRDVLEPIRREKAAKLAEIIYQRIVSLQNPIDCESTKFAVCKLDQCPGGFGCQLHHAALCLMMSYAMGRTLVLDGKQWRYAPERGFEGIFHPIGNGDVKCQSFLQQHKAVEWEGGRNDQQNDAVLSIWLKVVVDERNKTTPPDFLPMAIPEDLAEEMKSFHRQPFIWWAGLFFRYILRPRSASCQSLMNAIEKQFNIKLANFSQIKPLVGIHVRRSDKVGTEAQYHSLDEYMIWVIEYFDQLEYKLGHQVVRSVYIATDDPSISEEARKNYPGYTFYNDPEIAESASSEKSRYSGNALGGVLIDLTWLARSDFIVCTFTSNLCRLAFALLQTLHGDASDRFRSLDRPYFFWGLHHVDYEVVIPHLVATNPGEINLKIGQHFLTTFNSSALQLNEPFLNGIDPLTKREGIFPAYKLRQVINAAPMADYSHVNYKNDFKLPEDSCLLV